MVQVKKGVLENKIKFLLLCAIAETEPTNSYRLVDSLSKSQSIIYKQMVELLEKDYLIQNGTEYSINFKKIISEFKYFCKDKSLPKEIVETFDAKFWKKTLADTKFMDAHDIVTLNDLFNSISIGIDLFWSYIKN